MQGNIGETICQYRTLRKMTQEEFASRLGVTPQAVSKWERGNGLPDVSLLEGICKILGLSANTLLGIDGKLDENGDALAEAEIRTNLIAEPLVLEFGESVIPIVSDGLETYYVYERRKELAKKKGILMPFIRLRDNPELPMLNYRIISYDKIICEDVIDIHNRKAYNIMIDQVVEFCQNNYTSILNKQLVKVMIDNLKVQYPGVADDLIPEQISYLTVKRKLQEKLEHGESIKDLIHIIEQLEEQYREGRLLQERT